MSDPITLIAAGAAVGGLAGKFAEKAWATSERWLKERFGSHAEEARTSARENAANFVRMLAHQIKTLEDRLDITSKKIAAAEKHPQFSTLLQQSVINASQTDVENKHELLARLVATRMASEPESTVSLASQLASDAIARCTQRQLNLLGLCCFIQDIRPKDPMPIDLYKSWLDRWLSPFTDFEFKQFDAHHLVAVSCITYDPTSERSLEVVLQLKGGTEIIGESLKDVSSLLTLQFSWIEGLAGIILTSVGSIVGGLVLDQVLGMETSIGPPIWD